MGMIDRGLRSLLLSELISGMSLTLRYFFKPKVTLTSCSRTATAGNTRSP